MEYGKIEGLDKKVSRLVQGAIDLNTEDLEASFARLDAAFEQGINTFDTAHIYGGGEADRVLGLWMEARGNREEVVILGKSAHHNADRKRVTPFDISSDLFDSLARLRSDYMDVHLLHRDDPEVEVGPIVEILNEHLAAGRIRAFGGSNWTVERIQEANEYAERHGLVPFVASSPNFSLAEQVEEPWPGCISISGPQGEEARKWYAEQRMPLFTWSSLARGFLSGRITRENFEEIKEDLEPSLVASYCCERNFQRLDRAQALAREKGKSVAQIALAWVLNQPMEIFALVNARSEEEMDANVEALEIELTPQEIDWLDLKRDDR